MTTITMLNDVTPQEYGLEGQRDWKETVQWKAGQTCEGVDSSLADMFCGNGDAVLGSPEDSLDDIINSIDARNVERKMAANNLKTAIEMGLIL